MKPTIALLLGDRNGIGPELTIKLLARPETCAAAHVVVVGDPKVFALGEDQVGSPIDKVTVRHVSEARDIDGRPAFLEYMPEIGADFVPGHATEAAGREMLDTLSYAAHLARDGEIDGVVFAPLNKEAMHMGGLTHEDETQFLAEEIGHGGPVGELNVVDDLWTCRVTSHIPLKDVPGHITEDSVCAAIEQMHAALTAAGRASPRLGVAALNPHAGDGGNFGREEIDLIAPAVARARANGIDAQGPFPPDTVFVRARDGAFDAVVTMYHDQGQNAIKLMGFGRGATVLGGLPVPITTCGHGTGYDIVGKNRATDGSIVNAFGICCAMAARLSASRDAA